MKFHFFLIFNPFLMRIFKNSESENSIESQDPWEGNFYLGGYQDWEIWINAIPLHKIWISLQLSIGVLRIRWVTWVYVGDVIRIHEEISEDSHINDGHTLLFKSFKKFFFTFLKISATISSNVYHTVYVLDTFINY